MMLGQERSWAEGRTTEKSLRGSVLAALPEQQVGGRGGGRRGGEWGGVGKGGSPMWSHHPGLCRPQ